MLICVIVLGIACLFAGSSNMSFSDALDALGGKGTAANAHIIWKIRVSQVLAAVIAGTGLAVSCMSGSLLRLLADILSRSMGNGSALLEAGRSSHRKW